MAKHYTKLIIEINEDITSKVTAVKGDVNSRYLDVQLFNDSVPLDLTSHTVTMSAKSHPDSNFKVPINKFIDGQITEAINGRCQFKLKTDILGQAGVIILQISVFSGEQEVLSTNPFNLYVIDSPRNDEQIEASNEFGALVVLFSEIQNALDDMHAIRDNFGTPSEESLQAGTDTFWKALEKSIKGSADLVAYDISDENTLLLLHGEDFTDSSIYSEQITNTGCTLSDSGKFGKAISFTNLNKLETVEQIFDINGEFTIDFWFNQREKKANATFIGGTQTGTFKIILSNGVPVFQVHGQTSYYSSFVDTQLNTWYHFALTGKNKTYSMFVDGVKKNTFTYTGNISNDILRIGLNVAQNSTGSIEGVMDEIRISNVVRWDSDFTPPTEPYTVYKNAQAGEIYVKESGTWKKILTGMK